MRPGVPENAGRNFVYRGRDPGLFENGHLLIDFRSRHTVTRHHDHHQYFKRACGIYGAGAQERNNVVCGALLHDLGKIGIPVEILEFPESSARRRWR